MTTTDQIAVMTPASGQWITGAEKYVRNARAAATIRAYQSDWKGFREYCDREGVNPLPAGPESVAGYLVRLADAGQKAATIRRKLSAISQAHRAAGYSSPTETEEVRLIWSGIRRSLGTAQERKEPLRTEELRRIIAALPDSRGGLRDRALLLVGFAGAFRRSELAGLNVTDLHFGREGVTVSLRKSKTDPEGEGFKKWLPFGSHPDTCPIRAVEDWVEAAGITGGPLFRPVDRHGNVGRERLTGHSISRIVKRAVAGIGKDPADYGGHSLRAGFATQSAANGASERAIMKQTGHRSVTVLRRYIREGAVHRGNAAADLGL
ncbi:site-specific integrase [Kroppenstedtia eburnea]|uniref:site-specific integrase n=1 Tax=Kroppenstedtia eburnea TaxID=714067 RepID=UPI00362B53A1